MQYSELKQKSIKELEKMLAEYRAELFSLRFKNATRQLDQVHKIDLVKKDIARTLTAINEINRMASQQQANPTKETKKAAKKTSKGEVK